MSLEGIPPTSKKEEEVSAFEKQFENREYIDVPGGLIETVDVSPEKPKTEVPVLFLSGSHNAPESYEKTFEGIVANGRRIVTLAHPRNEEMPDWEPQGSRALLEANAREDGSFRKTEIRKVHNVELLIESKHLEKVDLVVHSEGSLHGIILALEHPDQVRNIILIAPAGLEGDETTVEIGLRIGLGMLKDRLQKLERDLLQKGPYKEPPNSLSPEAIKRRDDYIKSNKKRWSEEKWDMTNFHLDSALYELRGLYGIGISIIQGVNDSPVSGIKIQHQLKKGAVDGFYSLGGKLPGKHKDVIEYPEQLSWLIDHALTALEQRAQVASPTNDSESSE